MNRDNDVNAIINSIPAILNSPGYWDDGSIGALAPAELKQNPEKAATGAAN